MKKLNKTDVYNLRNRVLDYLDNCLKQGVFFSELKTIELLKRDIADIFKEFEKEKLR